MTTLKVAKSDNTHYWVTVHCAGHNFTLVADMAEQVILSVSSDWESQLPYTLSNILSGAMGLGTGNLLSAAGYGPQIQSLSFQMWMGTSPIEIPLTFLFDAEESAENEVFQPIAYLESLQFPTNGRYNDGGMMLWPPGPVRGGKGGGLFGSGGYGIDIQIGEMMVFRNCIMVNSVKTLDTLLDAKGYPIRGQLECTFRTSIVYGNRDYLTAMGLSSSLSELNEWTSDQYRAQEETDPNQ